jgi:outer membrane biosynthesis protein TonB
MSSRNLFLPVAGLVVLIVFIGALVHLLVLRYARGDIYRPYSTLRADPLGTRAFYEALDATGRFRVSRGFLSLHRELATKPGALFFLGLQSDDLGSFDKTEVAALDDFVRQGGRLVLTLQPKSPYDNTTEDDDAEAAAKKKEKAKAAHPDQPKKTDKPATLPTTAPKEPTPTGPQTEEEKYERDLFRKAQEAEPESEKVHEFAATYERSIGALWGFGWQLHQAADEKAKVDQDGGSTPEDDAASDTSTASDVEATRVGPGPLEKDAPWKSALFFLRLEPAWQVRYVAKDKPVLITRSWGKGQIIVASDSYFLSNEGLSRARRPALLSFVAGPPGSALFDEVHLGTENREGVMVLAERYRLEGYLLALGCVAALFLWRNSSPLVPPRIAAGEDPLGGAVSGKDSRGGLVNLLRRNLAVPDLLKTCLAEWKRGVHPGRRHLYPKLAEMDAALAVPETKQPAQIVETYRQLCEINAPRRMKGSHATKS